MEHAMEHAAKSAAGLNSAHPYTTHSAPTTTMDRTVLVIEDQPDIARLITMHVEDLNCLVETILDGTQGLKRAQEKRFDLIILDLMLPGKDGLEICKAIRGSRDYTPILMLTAKSGEIDRVLGLELGADDYLAKPFSVPELQARIKAIFRRVDALSVNQASKAEKIRIGDLEIDESRREVALADGAIVLTAKEFDLLLHFARNPGRIYTRAQLLDAVWGYSHETYEHNVNTHINRLRAKIERDPADPRYILTVRGVGYRFTDA